VPCPEHLRDAREADFDDAGAVVGRVNPNWPRRDGLIWLRRKGAGGTIGSGVTWRLVCPGSPRGFCVRDRAGS
jgi:hypothetical protein